jgi:hypothetical protein
VQLAGDSPKLLDFRGAPLLNGSGVMLSISLLEPSTLVRKVFTQDPVAISVPFPKGHQGRWGELCQCGIHLPCRIPIVKGRASVHPYVASVRHADETQGMNPGGLAPSCEEIRQGHIQHTRQAQIEHKCWLHAELPFIDRSGADSQYPSKVV